MMMPLKVQFLKGDRIQIAPRAGAQNIKAHPPLKVMFSNTTSLFKGTSIYTEVFL